MEENFEEAINYWKSVEPDPSVISSYRIRSMEERKRNTKFVWDSLKGFERILKETKPSDLKGSLKLFEFYASIVEKTQLDRKDKMFFLNLINVMDGTFDYIYQYMPEIFESPNSIFSIATLLTFHYFFSPVLGGSYIHERSEKCAIFLMLYVYVDYFIDDSEKSEEEKKEFMRYIPERILGCEEDEKFSKFNELMRLFEDKLPRETSQGAYDALMYAYKIEKKSAKLQYGKATIDEHETLVVEKGISTMMLFLFMEQPNIEKEEGKEWVKKMCCRDIAIIGQFTDDLLDLKNDMKNNRDTYCTLLVRDGKYLDDCFHRLAKVFDNYIQDLKFLEKTDLKWIIGCLEGMKADYILFLARIDKEFCSDEFNEIVKERTYITVADPRKYMKEARRELDPLKLVKLWRFNKSQ